MIFTKDQLNTSVTLLDGRPVTLDPKGETGLTVKLAIREALSASFQDEQAGNQGVTPISFDKKMKRYEISKKIWTSNGDVDLSVEELAEVKLCLGKYFYGEPLGFLINFIESK